MFHTYTQLGGSEYLFQCWLWLFTYYLFTTWSFIYYYYDYAHEGCGCKLRIRVLMPQCSFISCATAKWAQVISRKTVTRVTEKCCSSRTQDYKCNDNTSTLTNIHTCQWWEEIRLIMRVKMSFCVVVIALQKHPVPFQPPCLLCWFAQTPYWRAQIAFSIRGHMNCLYMNIDHFGIDLTVPSVQYFAVHY